MNFIKKIFDGKIDESVHLQFQKFGRGEFENKALIKAKYSKGKYIISTSAEFANELVRVCAEKLSNNKMQIKGVIISTNDLQGLDYKNKKQFMGVKQYTIDKEMSGKEILGLVEKFPKAFFALSFNVNDSQLKIKEKAPKSAKSSLKGEKKPKPDFCKLTTSDEKIAKDFVWEKDNFKETEINHTFIINELILPEGEKDFAKIREIAKRKGKIIREVIIDGQKIKSGKEFVA